MAREIDKKKLRKPDCYANHVTLTETETEVVLTFGLALGERNNTEAQVLLSPTVAAKLGALLAPVLEAETKKQKGGHVERA
jgi:hypothetical protein